jgi:hypothetical protein
MSFRVLSEVEGREISLHCGIGEIPQFVRDDIGRRGLPSASPYIGGVGVRVGARAGGESRRAEGWPAIRSLGVWLPLDKARDIRIKDGSPSGRAVSERSESNGDPTWN